MREFSTIFPTQIKEPVTIKQQTQYEKFLIKIYLNGIKFHLLILCEIIKFNREYLKDFPIEFRVFMSFKRKNVLRFFKGGISAAFFNGE